MKEHIKGFIDGYENGRMGISKLYRILMNNKHMCNTVNKEVFTCLVRTLSTEKTLNDLIEFQKSETLL